MAAMLLKLVVTLSNIANIYIIIVSKTVPKDIILVKPHFGFLPFWITTPYHVWEI